MFLLIVFNYRVFGFDILFFSGWEMRYINEGILYFVDYNIRIIIFSDLRIGVVFG